MAFGNNIKKLRRKKSDSNSSLRINCMYQDRQSADGKTAQDARI